MIDVESRWLPVHEMPPQLCPQLCGCRVWALCLRQEPLPQMDPGTEPLLLLQHKLHKIARPWVAQASFDGASTGMQMSHDCCGFRSETWRWQKKTRVWPPKSRNQSPCKIHGYLKRYGKVSASIGADIIYFQNKLLIVNKSMTNGFWFA